MAISVTKRPSSRCWSGNPIHYMLYSAAAEADSTNKFEIRIKFKQTGAAAYSDILVLPYKPVSGTAKVDIQDILDGLLFHELPYLPEPLTVPSPHISYKASGQFYIEFREITTAEPDPAWDDSEDAYERFVIKGGISFEQWRGDNYWINYFDVVKPFLSWAESGRLRAYSELVWLTWLNLTDIGEYDIKMKLTTTFTDGSQVSSTMDCPVPKYCVGYFPAGADQLKLDEIDPTKTVYYWEMQVIDNGSNPVEPLSQVFRYYLDNRNDYNDKNLHFRNSLGGLDSTRIRGVIEFNSQRDFSSIEKIVMNDYYTGHFINGRVAADNSTEILVYKGDIGHLGKEEQDRLRDIHLLREVWWSKKLKWLPVMLLTGSQKLKTTQDKRFSMPIEWCIASGGNYYYTPDNVDLQDGNIPTGLMCTAIIGDLEGAYVPGTGWVMNWSLVDGAPVKYFVSTPGVSGGAPGETIATTYTFPWLPVGDNVITVQPVCFIGGEYYLGAAVTVTVTVAAACVAVGISGAPVYLPNAIEDVPYNYVISLTGTAPFNINNIIAPAWMSIAVVGSTVEITGTPDGGDIGTDIDVSFDLDNCAATGTVSYADTIDVVAGAANGSFTATNEAVGSSFIKKIQPNTPPFYTISTGSIPVTAGTSAVGLMASAIATPVTVTVVVDASHKLELYKNAVLIESIDVDTSGAFSFAAVAFLITDNMEIKLKLP